MSDTTVDPRQNLEARRRRLSEINEETQDLNERLQRLAKEKIEVSRDINGSLPIAALPFELLSSIFAFTVADQINVHHFKALTNLGSVSSRWRCVVNNDCRLWQVFPAKSIVSYGQCKKILELYSLRSGKLPVDFYIGGRDYCGRALGTVEEVIVDQLVMSPGLLERIRTLYIIFTNQAAWDSLTGSETLERLVSLKSLTVGVPSRSNGSISISSIPDEPVFLSNLTIFRALNAPKTFPETFRANNLSVLDICDPKDPSDLFLALSATASTLQVLKIFITSDEAIHNIRRKVPRTVTLPHLTSFHCKGGIQFWVHDLCLPSLVHLDTDGYCANHNDMQDFFRCFSTLLISLRFQLLHLYRGQMNVFFLQMLNLKSLDLVLVNQQSSNAFRWAYPDAIQELFLGVMNLGITELKVYWKNHGEYSQEVAMREKPWMALLDLVSYHPTLEHFVGDFRSRVRGYTAGVLDNLRALQRDNVSCELHTGPIITDNFDRFNLEKDYHM